MRVAFIVYADFESLVKLIDTCEPEESVAKQYQKHTPLSFCYYIKCFDGNVCSQKPVSYTVQSEDEDVSQIFVDMLEDNVKEIYQRCRKPVKIIFKRKEKIRYQNTTKCWICQGELKNNDKTDRDHCHYTGKFRGASHNLKYRKPKFIAVVFHNLNGYDS